MVCCVLQLVGAEDIQDTFPGLHGYEWLGRSQDVPQTLELNVFLPLSFEGPKFSAETYHYEDDGDTQQYLDEGFQWTRFGYELTSNHVTFKVNAAVGSPPKAHTARSYSIRLRGCVPPRAVTVNGVPVAYSRFESVTDKIGANTWHFDGKDVATVIQLYQRFPVNEDVVVEVELPEDLQTVVRPGFVMLPGLVNRARLAKPMLDNLYPYAYPDDYDHVRGRVAAFGRVLRVSMQCSRSFVACLLVGVCARVFCRCHWRRSSVRACRMTHLKCPRW